MARKLWSWSVATVSRSASVRANEKPAEAYQKAEKDLNAVTNNSLRNNVRTIDYPGLEKDAEAREGVVCRDARVLARARTSTMPSSSSRPASRPPRDLETAAAAMNYNGVLRRRTRWLGPTV